jgi:chemotaxis protein MotB
MADENKRPIIIVKKKITAGGHHGGAWKVAYADFVTAMMAFFMVMWLVASVEGAGGHVRVFQEPQHGAGQRQAAPPGRPGGASTPHRPGWRMPPPPTAARACRHTCEIWRTGRQGGPGREAAAER